MAKPKGATLTRLFDVSERERQEFYESIQRKIQTIKTDPDPPPAYSGTPYMGIPETGIPFPGAPGIGVPEIGVPETYKKAKTVQVAANLHVRRALQVQDGHSLGEQLVLTTLWNAASHVDGKSYRRITIGYRTLSGMCGLTVNNCKANLKSLQGKLAIEPEAGHSNTTGTTYRVYSFTEILRRRETAGLTHVIRNKGARFVNPQSGIPATGTGGIPETGIPDSVAGIPATSTEGIPETGTHLRNKKEVRFKESTASGVEIVSSTIRKFIAIDDDAVHQIVHNCLQQDSNAKADEIAHFSELKLHQHRKNQSIQNLPGLLIRSVQDYFRSGSGELADFRAQNAQEMARVRELAEQLLNSPASTEEERQYAMGILNS